MPYWAQNDPRIIFDVEALYKGDWLYIHMNFHVDSKFRIFEWHKLKYGANSSNPLLQLPGVICLKFRDHVSVRYDAKTSWGLLQTPNKTFTSVDMKICMIREFVVSAESGKIRMA